MPKTTSIVTAAAVITVGAALAIAGTSLANAERPAEGVAAAQPMAGYSGYGPGRGNGELPSADQPGGRGGHAHTQVNADVAAKVTAAVKAKDATITVQRVMADADGSYDVHGTKADGSRVMVEVSKDLATVEIRTGGMGGFGKHGMAPGTVVSADTLSKIAAAVKAKDATVTVRAAMQLSDGTYRAMGTKADGTHVMVALDKALKVTNLETKAMGMRGMGGMGHHGMGPGATSTPKPSTTTNPAVNAV